MPKVFRSLYTERHRDPGWNVVQAATLLNEAVQRQTISFAIYAALELRMAIEQLVFTIITIAREEMDKGTVDECRKKDGLFRILNQIAPGYSLRCRFQSVAANFYPGIPVLGQWDVKSLIRCYSGLSRICHSELIVQPFKAWGERVEYLIKVHDFLAEGLSRPTAVMRFTDAKVSIQDLWEKYSAGEISLEDVSAEMRRRNPNPSAVIKTQKTILLSFNSTEPENKTSG